MKMRKRISTYVNLVSMVCGAAITFIPNLGLSVELTGLIMMVLSMIITAAQWYKQGGADV